MKTTETFELRPMLMKELAARYYPYYSAATAMKLLRQDITDCPRLHYHLQRLGVPVEPIRGRTVSLSLRAVAVIVRHLGWPEGPSAE